MAAEFIDLGNAPNDGLGDGARTGGGKINNNFRNRFFTRYVLDDRWHVHRTVYSPADATPYLLKVDDLVEGWENNITKTTWIKGVVLDATITLPADIRNPAKFFLMLDLERV